MAVRGDKYSAVPPPAGLPLFGTDDFLVGGSVASSDTHIQLGFLRKVFGLVATQLVTTALVCALFMFSPSAQNFVLHTPSMLMLTFFSSLFFLFACQCYKDQHPTNLYLLGGFTLSMSWSVGAVCAQYAAHGMGIIVLQAVFLTAAVTVGLTAYTLKSKQDFSFLGAGLSSALFVLIFGGLIASLTGSAAMHTALAVGGAAIFSLYIIFDVYMISRRLSPDEYISATISLYLDILNLFLHLLRILAAMQRSD
ncbi:hypothetical protein AB1Y20_021562 [Prymnesium parvum]|uniref:Transmembrane BAX inhibitor motif-containing protein 4 n=1 Tax=Prymnesium parvum TaxID=97485 RepID=A0AB34JLY8_PRYPA|mmetsp:Transcript_29721/g.68231  ORF Transcript_29721/g.68231 Transcript_29721/m.68231 type:complete len:252 (+) Transcript_29721:55-810(+)